MRHARHLLIVAVLVSLPVAVWFGVRGVDPGVADGSVEDEGKVEVRGAATAANVPAPVEYTVCLQPLGEHDATLTGPIGRGIAQAYGFGVRTLPARPLPASAWYPARSRHRADALLEHLLFDVLPETPGCHAVLGLTGVDISATRGEHLDWGVLGLAFFGQRVAVVSSYRLRAGVDGPGAATRAVKVAIHELGHVVGIPHRDDGAACVMNDAVGAVATIDKATGTLCAGERADAERFLGRRLPGGDGIDWDLVLGLRAGS